MKRYEDFNRMFGGDETAEEQAAGMMLAKVATEHKLDIDTNYYTKDFKIFLDWLNEEV